MWTTGLARWYAGHGRHDLPWRHTRDPWPVLVSEVMLQQTQVVRVRGRWESFLDRWPTPAACAADPMAEVLRFWQGLGYPRRARGLWLTAASVEAVGWPRTEQGLRALPGIGQYTARALLTLAMGQSSSPPLDVNLSRVAARAALGRHPRDSQRADIERAVVQGRPRTLDARDYTLALFDVGALHCRAIPRCSGCPLARRCRWLARGSPPATLAPGRGPALVFAGFPSDYSLGFLFALLQLDVRVVGIVTSPGAHPAILGDNALSRIAGHLGVPLLRAWRINDEHSRMSLAALHPDAVVMASFDQIVGHRALEIPMHG